MIVGDALTVLRKLPDGIADCCVTSPPYWSMRDYGHAGQIGREAVLDCLGWATGVPCGECYVCRQVAVFREVRRVLSPRGTLWLNLGNGYTSGGRTTRAPDAKVAGRASQDRPATPPGLKPKDLLGVPWRVAFALQHDGWTLRQEIIWQKPNTLPESVTDRCTNAHEQVFLLSRGARYFFDAEATGEPCITDAGSDRHKKPVFGGCKYLNNASSLDRRKTGKPWNPRGWRNRRSVWSIATAGSGEAHTAMMPSELASICIRAGCPDGGLVLDPFGGAGTTALVSERLQRRSLSIELNPEYAEIARRRVSADAPLFAGSRRQQS